MVYPLRGLDLSAIIETRGRPRRAATRQTIEKMRNVIKLDEDNEHVDEDDAIPSRSDDSEESEESDVGNNDSAMDIDEESNSREKHKTSKSINRRSDSQVSPISHLILSVLKLSCFYFVSSLRSANSSNLA